MSKNLLIGKLTGSCVGSQLWCQDCWSPWLPSGAVNLCKLSGEGLYIDAGAVRTGAVSAGSKGHQLPWSGFSSILRECGCNVETLGSGFPRIPLFVVCLIFTGARVLLFLKFPRINVL